MGSWAWFWIWVTLIVLSLVAFGFIGRSLFHRTLAVAHQVSRVATQAQKLVELIGSHTKATSRGVAPLISLEDAMSKRQRYLKAKAKKREERQRILIRSLKKYDSKESRFH
jgi:hypothetical protein